MKNLNPYTYRSFQDEFLTLPKWERWLIRFAIDFLRLRAWGLVGLCAISGVFIAVFLRAVGVHVGP